MADLNEQLWREQKNNRSRLIKGSAILLGSLFIVIGVVSLWITQPLIGHSEKAPDRDRADPIRLRAHVLKFSDDLYPRNHLSLQNLNRAADYIHAEFEQTGGNVSEQQFWVNGSSYRNVILDLGENTAERIVIGAHYDAAYDTHGADDNASGIAGLIELAKLLSSEAHSIQIEIVAYSLEEPPFFSTDYMGSFVHAKSLYDAGVKVKLMVCLEMIGYFSDKPDSQKFPFFPVRLLYPTTGNFVALVGNFTNARTLRTFKYSMSRVDGLETYSLNAPAFVGGIDLSDHRNYWRFGYDALMVTDTAFYRNGAYHTIDDTASRLDYVKMGKVVDAVNIAVQAAAN